MKCHETRYIHSVDKQISYGSNEILGSVIAAFVERNRRCGEKSEVLPHITLLSGRFGAALICLLKATERRQATPRIRLTRSEGESILLPHQIVTPTPRSQVSEG